MSSPEHLQVLVSVELKVVSGQFGQGTPLFAFPAHL
jgi:hypothetical protein